MVAGVVLAGGQSRRFGSDKRFFKLNGKTLFEAACDKITKVCDNNYIVSDKYFFEGQNKPEGFRGLIDLEDGKGPLMGIYSALTLIPQEGCLVIPVDMPELSISVLKHIKEQGNSFDIVIPYSEEYLPLPGYYSKKLLPLIECSFQSGDVSLKAIVGRAEKSEEMKVLRLSLEKIKRFGDPKEVLLNINTEDDVGKHRRSFGEK